MLAEARRWNRGLYIEIKHADPLAVLTEVTRVDLLDRCFFWGWDYDGLRAIKAVEPTAQIMTRRMDADRLADCFAGLDPSIIEYDSADDWRDMDEARGYGAALMICYMGRDPAQIDRLIAARTRHRQHRRHQPAPVQDGRNRHLGCPHVGCAKCTHLNHRGETS